MNSKTWLLLLIVISIGLSPIITLDNVFKDPKSEIHISSSSTKSVDIISTKVSDDNKLIDRSKNVDERTQKTKFLQYEDESFSLNSLSLPSNPPITPNADTTPPVFHAIPNNFTYSEGATGLKKITWKASDETAEDSYVIYNEGNIIASGTYLSQSTLIADVSGLPMGTYNITIVANDTSGNFVVDTKYAFVVDTTLPSFLSLPLDSIYTQGDVSNTISWTVEDLHPSTYNLLRNGFSVTSGFWTNGETLVFNIDGLNSGFHNYTLILYDTSGNSFQDTVIIEVLNNPDFPSFTYLPTNITINEDTPGQIITWNSTANSPDTFIIFRDGVQQASGSWNNEDNITLSLDTSNIGTYNYTILINDTLGNELIYTSFLIVADLINPIISVSPGNIDNYVEDSTGNELSWEAIDNYPGTYQITNNSVIIASDTWISNSPITINIDNLVIGSYDFVFTVTDSAGNQNSSLITVTVSDKTLPVLVSDSGNIEYIEGNIGNQLNWQTTDKNEGTYIIYENGTQVASGPWTNGNNITIVVDGLQASAYNYTVAIIDLYGNMIANTLWVLVRDVVFPIFISTPNDESYLEITDLVMVSWTATDGHPTKYNIYQNETLVWFGVWGSGVPINYNIGGRLKGIYNFTIVFFDIGGNMITNTILLSVYDQLAPVLTQIPNQSMDDEFSYPLGTTGNTLEWVSTDNHPDYYTIYFEHSLVQSESWSSFETISIDTDGLSAGNYNYTIFFYDESGNFVYDYVDVIVASSPVFTQIPDDIQILNGSTGNELIWVASDSNYHMFEIYQEEVLILNGSWINQIAINITIDGLDIGYYNFTISINDTDSNITLDTVFVRVTDLPKILQAEGVLSYAEGDPGKSIYWEALDSFPANYSLYKNGVLINQSTWQNGSIIKEYIDGLVKGTYSFTIHIYDFHNNVIIDTIVVTVIDNDNPQITSSPIDIEFEQGELNQILNWNGIDIYPSNFTVYFNGSEYSSGIWNNTDSIAINVDDLIFGYYNFTIIIADESGNIDFDTVWVRVNDITVPIISEPNDLTYNEGSTGNIITWFGSDLNAFNYSIYLGNGTYYTNGTWISGAAIEINIDGFGIGNYTLNITIFDINLNPTLDSVNLSVLDSTKTAPVIISPEDFSLSEGDVGNIIWDIIDDEVVTFTVYLDDTTISNPNIIVIESDYQVVISFFNFELGIYNFTIYVEDESGNISKNSVIVSIIDTESPFVTSTPNNANYNEGTLSNVVTWFAVDSDSSDYMFYINDSLHASDNWEVNEPISINIDGLQNGFHNLTLLIFDVARNYINSTVIIRVSDVTDPVFNLIPENLEILEGVENSNLEWNLFDINPRNYSIFVDGELMQSGSWDDIISFPVNNILAGSYNITLFVTDTSFNEISNFVILYIIDKTNPVLNTVLTDISFSVDSEGNFLIIDVFDNNPDSFIIELNNEFFNAGIWSSNDSISVNLDDLEFGRYNFTISIFDTSGNLLIASITIKVTSPLIVETLIPEILITQTIFESDIETFTSIWKDADSVGISNANIEIVLLDNGEEVEGTDRVFISTSTGEYILIFDYSNLIPGNYEWYIVFQLDYFESQDILIKVEILPHTYAIELLPNPTLIEGTDYYITARVTYANDINTENLELNQLRLNQISSITGAVEGIELDFEIQVSYRNGVQNTIILSAISDSNGIVTIFLSKGQTENLQSIDSITATITDNVFGSGPPDSLDETEIPGVQQGKGSPINFLNDLIAKYLVLGFIVMIISIIVMLLYILINRRRSQKYRNIVEGVKFGKSEFEGILSLQACIIMSKGGIPLFEERYEHFAIDPTLVAGMSAAISSFFNEFGTSDKIGFETIERSGMSITSHKSHISTIVLISSLKAPNLILEQVQKVQKLVESRYNKHFTTSEDNTVFEEKIVFEIFDKCDFKVSLLRNMTINKRNLNRLDKIRSISRIVKSNISQLSEFENSLSNDSKTFTIREVLRYYENLKLNQETIARLILLAYKHGVLNAEK